MKNNFNEISCCEVCGNKDLKSLLDLGLHLMYDDLVKVGDERICNDYSDIYLSNLDIDQSLYLKYKYDYLTSKESEFFKSSDILINFLKGIITNLVSLIMFIFTTSTLKL